MAVGGSRSAIAQHALERLGVDGLGLDGADKRYLTLIADSYGGGPVGIETIAAALSESRDAVEEVIEPYLLQQGLIQRTPRGRMLRAKGLDSLGPVLPPPPLTVGRGICLNRAFSSEWKEILWK